MLIIGLYTKHKSPPGLAQRLPLPISRCIRRLPNFTKMQALTCPDPGRQLPIVVNRSELLD